MAGISYSFPSYTAATLQPLLSSQCFRHWSRNVVTVSLRHLSPIIFEITNCTGRFTSSRFLSFAFIQILYHNNYAISWEQLISTFFHFADHSAFVLSPRQISCIFHQCGYLACFSTTGTSHSSLRQISWHISALHVHGIFQHVRYVTYFTTTDISYISPRWISCIFFHLCEILRFRSCWYCAMYIGR